MSLNRVWTRRVRRAALALCAAAVLSACGGGDRAEPFVPGRIFAFGDELSVLDTSTVPGQTLKYGVNGLNTAGQIDCTVNPLWIQSLANQFGMAFEPCPVSGYKQTAFTRAELNATVAKVEKQVDAYLRDDKPVEGDLVTMLAGLHDVQEVYEKWTGTARTQADRDAAIADIKSRAEVLAQQVKRIVDQGPVVIISSIPNLGQSPYAADKEKVLPGEGRQMLLDLSQAFNNALTSGGVGEGTSKGLGYYNFVGRDVGLIYQGASFVNNVYTSTSADTRALSDLSICTAALPICTTNTLNSYNGSTADINAWPWADPTHPGPGFQAALASRATYFTGSRGLPF